MAARSPSGTSPGGADALLAGLTDEQREAVTTEARTLLVLAPAGSGKTRVLTRRIAWQAAHDHVDPRRVLAVTFTRKAAAEMTRRLSDLGVDERLTAGTFHALALSMLRRHWMDGGRRLPTLLDRKARLVASVLAEGRRDLAGAVAREIEWCQARLVSPEEYEPIARQARRTPPLPPHEMATAYARYRDEKRRRGVVDFDDLLTLCAQEIESDTELAAAIRWRFRHVFVDEFQDVNPAQFRLLTAWLGDRNDLCAVGDDDQAIYGFGGADARYIGDFAAHFGDEARVVRLTANFRSTPQVLAAACAVLPPSDTRPRSVGAEGPLPKLRSYEDDRAEASGIAGEAIALQRQGVAWRDMAVLARTNNQLGVLEEVLRAARVPVRVRGATRFLDRPEVTLALHDLAEAERRAPHAPFPDLLAEVRPGADGAAVETLLDLGAEYAAVEGDRASVEGFNAYVAASMRQDDVPSRADAVELLTFHRAKGLEWPAVFVAGLEDGFVPISHAATDADHAEERRLLHVAMTRAARHLCLSWARRRTFGGRGVDREPSPYLADLDGVAVDRDDVAPSPEVPTDAIALVHRHLAETAATGASTRPPRPDPLFEALARWREHRARAAGVETAAIADDETLRKVAAARPGDEGALADVGGMGAVRLSLYGPEILAVVAGYIDEDEPG